MDFIQYGGLDLIEKAIRVHEKDNIIALELPPLMKHIMGINSEHILNAVY